MRKIISLILCVLMCLCMLCSCSSKKQTVLSIGQADVDSEIFAYFFSEVYGAAESSGGDLMATDELTAAAIDRCREYVASTTLFDKWQLSLSADSKLSIATSTEEEWKLYGEYYRDSGISKQTVAKIKEANEYRKQLLLYYFGEGSEYEVSEDEIEYYFDLTYVSFRAINGYFTTTDENGDTVPLPDGEMLALKASFEEKLNRLNAGAEFSEVNDGNDVEVTFVAVANPVYPAGFLEKVAELDYDKPAVIETDEYIFLVERVDAKKGTDNYYASYRTNYIEALRGEMLTDMLVATGEEYGFEQHEGKINKTVKEVISARNDRK